MGVVRPTTSAKTLAIDTGSDVSCKSGRGLEARVSKHGFRAGFQTGSDVSNREEP